MDKILRDKKAIFVFIAPALIMFLLVLDHPDDTNGLLLTLRLRSTYTP